MILGLIGCSPAAESGVLAGEPAYDESSLDEAECAEGCGASASTYGALMGTYRGVPAYSNGGTHGCRSCQDGKVLGLSCGARCGAGTWSAETPYGLAYQCVEYVRRFYGTVYQDQQVAQSRGNARDYAEKLPKMGFQCYSNGATEAPRPDDILVFRGGKFGHIAIVRAVGPRTVQVIQQNNQNNMEDARCTIALDREGDRYRLGAPACGLQGFELIWCRRPGHDPMRCSANLPCPDGMSCFDGACRPDGAACQGECPRAGQTQCVNSGTQQTCADYNADGCLEWGSDRSCACSGQTCEGDPCAGVSCNNPPAARCQDGVTVRSFQGGSCRGGVCSYAYSDTRCQDGNACTDDLCQGGGCVFPPIANDCGSRRCGSSVSGCHSCGTCPSGESCQGGSCVATSLCGDGACGAGETPDTCPADCGVQFVSQDRLGRFTNGDCASKGDGWHPAGGIVYWTFATSCSLPSLSTPESYARERGRWHHRVRKAGRYRITVKVPPTGAACNFAVSTYTKGARYLLTRPGMGTIAPPAPVNQQANIGTEAVVFPDVTLGTGDTYLYLYDSVTDVTSCCACDTPIRVFFDYARLTWIGP